MVGAQCSRTETANKLFVTDMQQQEAAPLRVLPAVQRRRYAASESVVNELR